MEMKRLNGQGMKAAGYDERNRKLVVETSTGTFDPSLRVMVTSPR